MTCRETIAIGAYVLGALDAAERLQTERHLRDCASCREALLQFAHLPGLLHTLTLEDVTSTAADPDPDLVVDSRLEDGIGPSRELGPDLGWLTAAMQRDRPDPLPASPAPAEVSVSSAATSRRAVFRRRVRLAAATATVIVLAGGFVARQVLTDQAPRATNSIAWSATDGAYGIDTTAQLTSRPWGTDIRLRLKDLRGGLRCKLVVYTRNGASETTGWWATSGVQQAEVPASTSFPLADIDRIEVVTADNTVLTTLTESTR
ncbi:hypothetical protein JOF29_000110 [Kribbella aluminosa]|uniref:Putative zinc-finger domain-containing protein n=1 Tax=Kribbella aluminosa TaxID=416017 RepID=A0ABS4UBM1_9ACTN|nr:zf-HC2 domain-containing protein [Kribbella aluminosa]MBP2349027.1 hypothetical protein [Kribbella aluminosa]